MNSRRFPLGGPALELSLSHPPEEQTSACLLCVSVSLWFNLLAETLSKKVYHRDAYKTAEAQRRQAEVCSSGAFLAPREESRTLNNAVSGVFGSLVTRPTSRGAMKATLGGHVKRDTSD